VPLQFCHSEVIQLSRRKGRTERRKRRMNPREKSTYGGGRSITDMALCLVEEILEQKR